MNPINYQILEDLLDTEIAKVNRDLKKNQKSRELRQDLGHATDIHDLTDTRLYAKLGLLNETLGHLIDWSNE